MVDDTVADEPFVEVIDLVKSKRKNTGVQKAVPAAPPMKSAAGSSDGKSSEGSGSLSISDEVKQMKAVLESYVLVLLRSLQIRSNVELHSSSGCSID